MTAAATTIETGNLEIKAEVSIDDTGTVTGIAWPFGQPDSYGDLIEPSAFSFAPRVPMIVEHEQKSVVGVWESYSVTDKGLEVKGRLLSKASNLPGRPGLPFSVAPCPACPSDTVFMKQRHVRQVAAF